MTQNETHDITSADHLIATIPYLLGFRPDESLVIAFTGADLSVRLTVRIDIGYNAADDTHQWPDTFAQQLATAAHSAAAINAYLLAYTGNNKEAEMALKTAQQLLSVAGVTVKDSLVVTDQHWYRLRAGTPGKKTPIAAAAARETELILGQAPSRRRDDVIDEFKHDPENCAYLKQHQPRATAEPARTPDETGATAERLRGHLLNGPHLSPESAWDTLNCLQHVHVRDTLIYDLVSCSVEDRGAAIETLAELTRSAPKGHVSVVATVAAATLFPTGDGVRIEAALTRALNDNPRYPLAVMLTAYYSRGLNPAAWAHELKRRDRDTMLGKTRQQRT